MEVDTGPQSSRSSLITEFSGELPIRAQLFDVRGIKIAGFMVNDRPMVCLPQIYEIFLKELVGGLHTIYTKLKRLNIHPLVCNVEQVRALRMAGAIQCGVNRCKLIDLSDLSTLLMDCEDASTRPGRPPKKVASIPELHPESRQLCSSSSSMTSFSNNMSSTMSNLSSNMGSNLSSNHSCSLQILNELLPFNQPTFVVQQMVAAAVAQQLNHQHLNIACPSNASSTSFNLQDLNFAPSLDETQSGQEKSEEWLKAGKDDNKMMTEPMENNEYKQEEPSSHESSEEKALDGSDSSLKPSGRNSETDTSFYREKSSSTNDQDSGSGAQSSTSPRNEREQGNGVLSSVVSLIDTAQNSLKKQSESLTDLIATIHGELKEFSRRDRISRMEIYMERQKAAHYMRRYTALKYIHHNRCHHHKKHRHKTEESTQKDE
uniref:Ski_Sno domain-containing protein n=2 Tax=Bursaphelenchus xylophilus TaxID=6326 RepID=A0A1I7ST86_BURXY